MAHVIAVAGKGGVGKTTLCGMLIQYLCEQGKGPVLAVDADANSNLNEVLGVKVETTLGDVREEIARAELSAENPIPAGVSKADYAEMRFEDALTEDDDFDLLVMGRTQGKGCYCYVNGLLQTQLARYQNSYPYFVVDNEAGMEHISRGVLPTMQTAILVSDCSRRGIQAVGRIARLIDECEMHPDTVGLIVKRAPNGELNPGIWRRSNFRAFICWACYRRMKWSMSSTARGGRRWNCRRTIPSRRQSGGSWTSWDCKKACCIRDLIKPDRSAQSAPAILKR